MRTDNNAYGRIIYATNNNNNTDPIRKMNWMRRKLIVSAHGRRAVVSVSGTSETGRRENRGGVV